MPGKKFRFPLENVLKLREQETESAQRRLVSIQGILEEQESRIEDLHRHIEDLHRQSPQYGTADTTSLRRYDAYRRQAQNARELALQKLEEIQQEEDLAREHLLQRRRDEESLNTLREQSRQRFDKAQSRTEAAFLDEQAVMRFNRKQPFGI